MVTRESLLRWLKLAPQAVLHGESPEFRSTMGALVEDGLAVLVADAGGREFWVLAGSPDAERLSGQAPGRSFHLDHELADHEAARIEDDRLGRDL